jgi:hypothetical protein
MRRTGRSTMPCHPPPLWRGSGNMAFLPWTDRACVTEPAGLPHCFTLPFSHRFRLQSLPSAAVSRLDGVRMTATDRVLKKCRPHGLPDRKAGNASACTRLAHPGRGHRPCHSARLIPGQPGAQSPRPAPAPPSAGASRPPGRALACRCAGCTGLGGSVAQGRGKRGAFPVPAQRGQSPSPDREDFLARQAVGLPFQHASKPGVAAGLYQKTRPSRRGVPPFAFAPRKSTRELAQEVYRPFDPI